MITNILIKSQKFIDAEILKKGLINNFNVNILDEIINEQTKIIYFISHAFLLVRCSGINNNNFEEIAENRISIINEFLSNQTDNVILIKYEELINNFNDVINNLISKFNLESKNNNYNMNDFINNKLYHNPNNKLIDLFNEKINIEI